MYVFIYLYWLVKEINISITIIFMSAFDYCLLPCWLFFSSTLSNVEEHYRVKRQETFKELHRYYVVGPHIKLGQQK